MARSQPINHNEPLEVKRSRQGPVHSRVRSPEYEDCFSMKLKGDGVVSGLCEATAGPPCRRPLRNARITKLFHSPCTSHLSTQLFRLYSDKISCWEVEIVRGVNFGSLEEDASFKLGKGLRVVKAVTR